MADQFAPAATALPALEARNVDPLREAHAHNRDWTPARLFALFLISTTICAVILLIAERILVASVS